MGIAQKSLLMFLAITAATLVLVLLVSEQNIKSGFAAYLAKSELQTVETIPALLIAAYDRNGSWSELKKDPHFLDRFFAENEIQHHPDLKLPLPMTTQNRTSPETQGPGPGPGPDLGLGLGPGPDRAAPPFPPFRLDLLSRLAVFDSSNNLIGGNPAARNSEAIVDLFSSKDGKKQFIGSLKLAASPKINREMDHNFLLEQNRSLAFLCAATFLLAAAAAFYLSKDLVSALDQIVNGTKQLISGNWQARIEVSRKDELGQLAGDLNRLAATLQQYDRAHKQWLADTSHELRTPVAVLWAQIEAIQDGIQEATPASLSVLHKEVQNLAKMIDDLHDLARYDVGDLQFNLLPCNPGKAASEVLDLYKEEFCRKEISISSLNLETLPGIKADEKRLKQVFGNLLQNSLKFTNEGGKVTIEGSLSGNKAQISIDDSEPAVPDEYLDLIFDRFCKPDSARSRVMGGRGLGLAICKSIVEAHGGSIKALKSALGGLRVEITLPTEEPG